MPLKVTWLFIHLKGVNEIMDGRKDGRKYFKTSRFNFPLGCYY